MTRQILEIPLFSAPNLGRPRRGSFAPLLRFLLEVVRESRVPLPLRRQALELALEVDAFLARRR